nr:MAG TPA: C2H2 type zinc-finger protein [Caudoviricetes sp.]
MWELSGLYEQHAVTTTRAKARAPVGIPDRCPSCCMSYASRASVSSLL